MIVELSHIPSWHDGMEVLYQFLTIEGVRGDAGWRSSKILKREFIHALLEGGNASSRKAPSSFEILSFYTFLYFYTFYTFLYFGVYSSGI